MLLQSVEQATVTFLLMVGFDFGKDILSVLPSPDSTPSDSST